MSAMSRQATGGVVGFLAGGAAGFVLTEAVAVFFHLVLDHTLDVDGTGSLLAVFIGVPVLCAVLGAVIGVRLGGRQGG
ncbi:hypothetical protein [Actinomadura livida]|uniref:Major facilitator superfamily (MFS) profile domain-containing protein n=1 Tax=Actinomadura livida TaxID=79909 RepID=A0A7W7MY67_9ACTN|nr:MULTISPECIES: hypothetical protein [Actinomadura]MBB4775581.1 hypothetical protein [Actinomadura catellatispora]GGT91366.1 hypothetical protein GCM10010208_13010 [Actinomadura livida]